MFPEGTLVRGERVTVNLAGMVRHGQVVGVVISHFLSDWDDVLTRIRWEVDGTTISTCTIQYVRGMV